VDEVLKRAFVDAYLHYETTFARFTTSNNAGVEEAEQQACFREFADAQHTFLQSAHRLARGLLEQTDPSRDATYASEPEERSDGLELPGEPKSDWPQRDDAEPAHRGSFLFRRSR
jgi:hypothetical protein